MLNRPTPYRLGKVSLGAVASAVDSRQTGVAAYKQLPLLMLVLWLAAWVVWVWAWLWVWMLFGVLLISRRFCSVRVLSGCSKRTSWLRVQGARFCIFKFAGRWVVSRKSRTDCETTFLCAFES